MKKITAVLCTFALAASLTACGIERPDLDTAAKDQAAGSADLKKFDIKDNHARADLSERFHIDAAISGNDADKLSSYELTKFKMTEDEIAGQFFPGGGYNREDRDTGAVEYTKDKETLYVQFVDLSSMAILNSPAVTYQQDKGTEYGAIMEYFWSDDTASDEGQEKAVELVKDKLDKLNVEYGDLTVFKMDHDTMNNYYAQAVKDLKEIKEEAESDPGEEGYSYQAELYRQGRYADLDENFSFTAEDDCYIIKGYLHQKGLPVFDYNFQIVSIKAAVSSRGIEYLYVDNLYSAENPYAETSVVSVEQAVNSLYQAFDSSALKDKTEVTVDEISLAFMKQSSYDDSGSLGTFSSKTIIIPAWAVKYHTGEEDPGSRTCIVSATDGKLQNPGDYLFNTENYDVYETE